MTLVLENVVTVVHQETAEVGSLTFGFFVPAQVETLYPSSSPNSTGTTKVTPAT